MRPFLALILTAALWAIPGCRPGEKNLHLVIDAGSSGTRFCLFEVEAGGNPVACHADPAAEPFDRCQKVKSRDGLADLAPEEIDAVLAAGMNTVPPGMRAELDGVVLLGTGGFRRQTPAARDRARQRIATFFAGQKLPAHVEVITGQKEAMLAWQAVRQSQKSDDHAILETGGATVQFAAGAPGRPLEAISLPLGMNDSFKNLRRLPAFASCYALPNADRSRLNFDACLALVSGLFAASPGNTLGPFVERSEAGAAHAVGKAPALYGLGSPWSALFDLHGKEEMNVADMKSHGARFCAMSIEELTAKGIPAKHAPRNCFLWAYQTALLAATGLDKIREGGESWPRGAAASPNYFPVCGGE